MIPLNFFPGTGPASDGTKNMVFGDGCGTWTHYTVLNTWAWPQSARRLFGAGQAVCHWTTSHRAIFSFVCFYLFYFKKHIFPCLPSDYSPRWLNCTQGSPKYMTYPGHLESHESRMKSTAMASVSLVVLMISVTRVACSRVQGVLSALLVFFDILRGIKCYSSRIRSNYYALFMHQLVLKPP